MTGKYMGYAIMMLGLSLVIWPLLPLGIVVPVKGTPPQPTGVFLRDASEILVTSTVSASPTSIPSQKYTMVGATFDTSGDAPIIVAMVATGMGTLPLERKGNEYVWGRSISLIFPPNTLFTFALTYQDAQGDQGSKTYYAKTGETGPGGDKVTGKFYINGIDTTGLKTIPAQPRELKFKFWATANGDKVTKVEVSIGGEGYAKLLTLTETSENKYWEGTDVVPRDGNYMCEGTVSWDGEGAVMMSIGLGAQQEEGLLPEQEGVLGGGFLNYQTMGAILATIGGALVLFTGRGKE